jgi:porin
MIINKLNSIGFRLLTRFLFFYFSFNAHAENTSYSISSNPAAVNLTPGTGVAQHYFEKKLGIQNNHGIYVDGAWIGDINNLSSGGINNPDRWTSNSLFLLNMTLDTKKIGAWDGGLFGVQFLQFNGQATNAQAGTVQGYNSLPGAPPLNRSELYQLWYRQEFLNKKFMVRIGKVAPTFHFNNVINPVPLYDEKIEIPAVTSLIYTPVFVNPSVLGLLPGYYNSAYGITISFTPSQNWYLSLGSYDGNLANGTQTGLTGPHFNGSYFNIAETGFSWFIGKNKLPGTVGVGAWHQTGLIQESSMLFEHGASGYYLFGSQRLWYKNPGINNGGISAFYQYGENNSSVLPMKKYVGAGLTFFGLIPSRENDSMGMGTAFSWLNQKSFSRKTELMLQAYYQAKIINGIFLEPALSYIPTPGAQPNLHAAWVATMRLIVLF